MRFWDSSAVVPLLVAQAESARMTALFRADRDVVTWWATRVECDSAVARLERDGQLEPAAATAALARLDRLAASWGEVRPHDRVRVVARRLLRTHALRAGDAQQLAAAVLVAEGRTDSLPFVSLDDRLCLAAEREGFPAPGPAAA